MAKTDSRTPSNVIDFAKAREARIRHARPLQRRLLTATPTTDLLRSIRRDQVRQAARAAL